MINPRQGIILQGPSEAGGKPMIQWRRSRERGRGRESWLESRYSFSFAHYFDPDHSRFRALRVLNEDWIAPGSGFGLHPHRDMEILTYPIAGTLEHRDSEGNASQLTAGRVQLMSAGTGIAHSEVNASNDTLHLLQIWLTPDRPGHRPSYQELDLDLQRDSDSAKDPLRSIVTPDGRDGTLRIRQDVFVSRVTLLQGESLEHPLAPGRHAWLQFIRGGGTLDGAPFELGDGAALSAESSLTLDVNEETEALLFDLA
jgi:redox-sensitive bicupin YhaK (pirin superfamily)